MSCVLITGCSSGIGLATALAMAGAGHTVYATMRNPERAGVLREAIEKETLPITVLPLDVDSDESVEAAVSAIRSRTGPIDVLINNAGIERIGSVEELPFEAFRAAMETNYFGCLRCIRACLPEMRERRSGCIVNVSSVAGRIACSPMAPYAASKFALEALSEALAQEVKPYNIRVAIIQPGIIDTPLARRIETPVADSRYAQARRFSGMFTASLANPAPPQSSRKKFAKWSRAGPGGSAMPRDPTPSRFSPGELP